MGEIRELRERAGVTQAQLARAGGTSQPTIAAYEAGIKSPSLRTLQRLARTVDLEAYISFHPPMTREEHRSLTLHRAIARRLVAEPISVLRLARRTITRMSKIVTPNSRLLREWRLILGRPVPAIVDTLVDPSPWARELRHVTPFAGILSATERAAVYREFAEEHNRHQP